MESFFLTEHLLYHINYRRNGAVNCYVFSLNSLNLNCYVFSVISLNLSFGESKFQSYQLIFSLSSLSLTSVQDKRDKSKPPSRNAEQNEQEGLVESKNSKATCGKCVHCVSYMDKLRAMFKEARKEIAIWCGLVYCKLQENYQRFKALWKSRMPSVKVR